MVVEENGGVSLVQCPWCKCMFCCLADLDAHLQAFVVYPPPVNCAAVNDGDHKRCFVRVHYLLENTLGDVDS